MGYYWALLYNFIILLTVMKISVHIRLSVTKSRNSVPPRPFSTVLKMSENPKNTELIKETLEKIHGIYGKKCNCTMALRAELWLRHTSEELELTPSNFHDALAEWLANTGMTKDGRKEDVAAALYCLGVTNSNNLFQKVQQGKMSPFGIGKNGRRNGNTGKKK